MVSCNSQKDSEKKKKCVQSQVVTHDSPPPPAVSVAAVAAAALPLQNENKHQVLMQATPTSWQDFHALFYLGTIQVWNRVCSEVCSLHTHAKSFRVTELTSTKSYLLATPTLNRVLNVPQ